MTTVEQSDLAKLNYDSILDIYRQRSREKAARSQGLERYLYEVFGSDLIASTALALDPWARFRFPKVQTAPLSRTRKIKTVEACPRSYSTYWFDTTSHVGKNSSGSWDYADTTSSDPPHTYPDDPQQAIYGFISDTTRRTRPIGCEFGEFELFLPNFQSSTSGYTRTVSTYVWVDTFASNDYFYLTDGKTTYVCRRDGPSYLLNPGSISVSGPRSRGSNAFAKHGLKLVVKSLPTARRYRSVYQIGELKDTPQLIFGTLKAWRDFEAIVGTKRFIQLLRSPYTWDEGSRHLLKEWAMSLRISNLDRDLSNAYLCFKFGWESTVSAINDLVSKPEKIAKEINRLIERNGLATSFRSSMSWVEPEDSPPSPYLRGFATETQISSSNSGKRNCTLRCMVNASFEFPSLDLPRLRNQLWIRKLGLDPRPSDIYDLIPWTWLIDWFSGLGEYVHVMDSLYQDQSLINYGFLTYKEESECTSTSIKRFESRFNKSVNGVGSTRIVQDTYSISGIYSHKYIVRKDLSKVAGIKTPVSASLTSTQKLILGALFGAKNNIGAQVARR